MLSSDARPSRIPASNDLLRTRNNKKDDSIRKKAEQDLKRKPSFRKQHTTTTPTGRILQGSVASLRPSAPLIVSETATINQCAILMATSKSDSVLIVDVDGNLSGILTDKDIAYRLVAESLDARVTLVSRIMTPNPTSVLDTDNRNEALSIMTTRKFRHLPVLSSQTFADDGVNVPENNVLGLLDITKCVFDRLGELEKKVNEDLDVISAMTTLEMNGTIESTFAQNVFIE